jgi:nicotinate-nucleotide adenylyltransferase
MLERAVRDNSRFTVSRLDVDRSGPHYTLHLLKRVRESYGDATELFFLMGADSLVDLPDWHRPEEIVALARLGVVRRPGFEPDVAALERQIPGLTEAVIFVSAPMVGVSASGVRRRAESGRSIRYLVPDAVEDYIRQHGLYVSPTGRCKSDPAG